MTSRVHKRDLLSEEEKIVSDSIGGTKGMVYVVIGERFRERLEVVLSEILSTGFSTQSVHYLVLLKTHRLPVNDIFLYAFNRFLPFSISRRGHFPLPSVFLNLCNTRCTPRFRLSFSSPPYFLYSRQVPIVVISETMDPKIGHSLPLGHFPKFVSFLT